MLTITKNSPPFARLTEALDGLLFNLQPCARSLCYWLHRAFWQERLPNDELIINFADFEAYSANRSTRPYTLKWIRRCYALLIERGFIEEVDRYSANVRRLKVVFVETIADLQTRSLKSPDRSLNFPNGNFKRRLDPSNPDSLVAESRSGNFLDSNAEGNEQGEASYELGLKNDLLNRAKKLGADLTPSLMQAAATATVRQLENAIARLAEHLESGGEVKKSVSALLNYMIQRNAYPNSQKRSRRSGAGTTAGAGSGSGSGADAGAGSGSGSGTDAGAGSGSGSGADAGAGSGSGSSADAGAGSGSGSSAAGGMPPDPNNEASPEEVPEMPQELVDWFELAKRCNVATDSRYHWDGFQFFHPFTGWMSWEEATSAWSLKKLQKMSASLPSKP